MPSVRGSALQKSVYSYTDGGKTERPEQSDHRITGRLG
jgi:hypothetical protein